MKRSPLINMQSDRKFSRYLVASFLIILVCLTLLGCTSGVAKVKDLGNTLLLPPNSVLIYEQEGVRQGAQTSCTFPYVKQLFGSDDNFEQIVDFYERILNPEEWSKRTDDLVPQNSPSWERNKEYLLSIREDPSRDFPEEVVNDARSKYQTAYFLTITYVDYTARKHCLNW